MTMLGHALNASSLWLIGVVLFVALELCAWGGTGLRRLVDRDRAQETSVDGYLLSAALALLGLLIAFTFSLALSRYDARRNMVVEEGNAIGTAWLRATLAEGPASNGLRESMKAYVDTRLRLPESSDPVRIEQQSTQAQALIWQNLRATVPAMPPPIAATLVTATTEMFDAAARRKYERRARIPAHVLGVVGIFALMSAGITGYVLGRRGDLRHAIVSTILFLLLTMAITLILDLDRPWSGSITISQQPIIDARAGMD
jgi:uncharacterized membrane protein